MTRSCRYNFGVINYKLNSIPPLGFGDTMVKEKPTRLFKYRSFDDRALDMLALDQVYFADPSKFNDPLDVEPVVKTDIPDEDLKRVLSQLIQNRAVAEMKAAAKRLKAEGPKVNAHIDKNSRSEADRQVAEIRHFADFWGEPEDQADSTCVEFGKEIAKELRGQYEKGICSLSERFDCPIMWSHYGDQHRGICVGYSVPNNSWCDVHPVMYGGSREVEASKIMAMLDEDSSARQDVDQAVLLRKANGWEYEREWRLIGNRGSFPSPLEIEEVIFGMCCKRSVKFAVVTALEGRERPIDFFEMDVIDGGFDLQKLRMDRSDLKSGLPTRSLDIHEAFSELDGILVPE